MDSYISLISPALTVVGWSIAYRLAKVNSTRTESKSLLDGCGLIIEKLAEEGSSFFLKGSSSLTEKKAYESLVHNKIALLHNKFEYLDKRGIKLSLNYISELHISLTYSVPQHGSAELKSEKCVNDIFKCSSSTILVLQMKFHEKYPPIDSFLSLKHYLK